MPPRDRSLFDRARERVSTPGTSAVVAGSLVSGVGAYVFQLVGTRTLSDEAYAPIAVLWTMQYLAVTIALVSVEAYVTRAVTLHPDEPGRVDAAVRGLSVWVVGVAAALGAASWLWRDELFHGHGGELPLVAALTVFGYGLFAVTRGRLAGGYRFREYGLATAGESLARLAVAVPVALVAASTRSLAWTLPLGPFLVAAWWSVARRRPYRGPQRPEDADAGGAAVTGSTSRYLVATTVANAVSQSLLAAGPLVLIPLGATAAETSVFFVTVTAARVPMVFAFGGLLSRVLPPLTRVARAGDYRRLRRLAAATCGTAAVLAVFGALAGAAVGPQIIALFFGAAFRPAAWFVALTVAGVVTATAALGLNQVLIGMGAETRLLAPWLVALLAGVATVLLVQAEPTFRVAAGFVAGEVVALAGLLAAVLTARPAPAARPPAGAPAEPVPAPLRIVD